MRRAALFTTIELKTLLRSLALSASILLRPRISQAQHTFSFLCNPDGVKPHAHPTQPQVPHHLYGAARGGLPLGTFHDARAMCSRFQGARCPKS